MKTRRWIVIASLAGLTFAAISCAPVDPPALEDVKTPGPAPTQATPLPPPFISGAGADGLKARIDAAIDQVKHRDLLTTNGFWTVFHGILGLGPSVELLDPATGKRYVALDYIDRGGQIRGLRFLPTRNGLDVETRPGTFVSQGHQDQFVAEMVEWEVAPDRKFLVNGEEHPFIDFCRESKARASVKENQELDWAVLIIGQYFGTDVAWTNANGESLHFEDLLRKELDAPLDQASCGGTHRLFGLTWVYHLHLAKGGQTTGIWKEVADKTAHYRDLAQKYQNADASFSTNFFRGTGDAPDIQLRINTTGHVFEWLALAGTDAELQEPWMRDAASALSLMILNNDGTPLEGGTLYHAVHGLLIYRARIFGAAGLGPMTPHPPLLPKEKMKAF
jgi:hypothetical protein